MENTPKDPKDRKPRTRRKRAGAHSSAPDSGAIERSPSETGAPQEPPTQATSEVTAPKPTGSDKPTEGVSRPAPAHEAAGEEEKTERSSEPESTAKPTVGQPADADRRAPASHSDSIPTDETSSAAHRGPRGALALVMALLALLVALGGTGFTLWQWQQEQAKQASAQGLLARIATLEQSLEGQSRVLEGRIEQAAASRQAQASELAALQDQQDQLQLSVEQERRRMQARKPHDWMLAEADYLVRMAGRKLWLEQDPATAQALLSDADQRLAQLDDPSIGPLRRALAADLATLAKLPRVDRAGLVAQMEALIQQVDNLPLNQVSLPEPVADEDPTALSAATSDWRSNLVKSWHALVDDFITIRRRDGAVQPLLAPDQDWYLREHIKGKLMQAQLALYHADQASYVEILGTAEGWIRDYFDLDDGRVQRALVALEQWQSTEIAAPQPIRFGVADPLSELVAERLGLHGEGR
ncbi:uroporphyrinogen-III C-methyltransferase [Ferrimonas gelatinilytica]|uniref:Uroporphyrin-3 C-methyltransferase n=1 Tax=Ferrimonas gelatinilytica TaxID=1255257 RepID=A0ABP9RUC1_9GAMM